jgi:uncharacterized membrane protein YqaE (UPF0057 family)
MVGCRSVRRCLSSGAGGHGVIDYDRRGLPTDSASRNGSDPRARITTERVVVLAYILAVAFPPIGFFMGVGLGARAKSKHWVWIVLVSIAASVIWAVIIKSGALSTTNDSY